MILRQRLEVYTLNDVLKNGSRGLSNERVFKPSIFGYKGTMKVVSACLAGVPCRFDCQAKERAQVRDWVEQGLAVAVCPEQMGGLSTPRPPSEIQNGKVMTNQGVDVTAAFVAGAEVALKVALENGATEAYLKSKSPSCGFGRIYDGSFTGKTVEGNGLFAEALLKAGIKVTEVD